MSAQEIVYPHRLLEGMSPNLENSADPSQFTQKKKNFVWDAKVKMSARQVTPALPIFESVSN